MADSPLVGAAARISMCDDQPTIETIDPRTGEAVTFAAVGAELSVATPMA